MRAAEVLLSALSCPVADDASAERMQNMSTDQITSEFIIWLNHVKSLNREIGLVTETPMPNSRQVNGSFSHEDQAETVSFHLLTSEDLLQQTTDEELEALALSSGASLPVLCLNLDIEDSNSAVAQQRLVGLAGSPVPRWLVLEPRWLAAAVVLKAKPFVHGRMRDDNQGIEPYFTDEPAESSPVLNRVGGSTRRTIDSVRLEPHSLGEKVREISLRLTPPGVDTTLVTTFLPPVTHSPTALVRYYAAERDADTAAQLIAARQAAERATWETHIKRNDDLLILDRQQVEEYFEAPEYYQMRLSPDELDEQVAYFVSMLQQERFSVALCPEAIDIPFRLESDRVEIRGDRRNKSEPRPGRVNGLTLAEPGLVEELRREAGSLLQITEPQFKDKNFVQWWIEWLASSYRKATFRGRP